MITVALLKYWKHVIIMLILGSACFLGYQHIYHMGYSAASIKYERQISEYNIKLDTRIAGLEAQSTVLVEQTLLGGQAIKLDMDKLAKAIKGKPLYTIDTTGKCQLSSDFIKAYNDGINRANSK